MAVFNEPTKWAQTLGKDADVTNIPDTAGDTDPSIDKIFPSVFSIPLARGGRAIPRSVLNGLFKLLGDWSFYQQNGGVPSYNAHYDYVAGRVVLYNDNIYKCIQANGVSSTVVTPDSDTAYWQRVALNNDLENYLPLVGGNITGNLTVQNKNLVRSVNGVNADESGNVSISIPFIPDYTSAISISQNDYVAPQDGWINFETSGMKDIFFTRYLSINNIFVGGITFQSNYVSAINVMVKKGDLVSVWLPEGTAKAFYGNLKFYPFRG